MIRPSRAAVLGGVLLLGLALSGCGFGPDPETVRAQARVVFDDLVGEMAAADPAVLRAVEPAAEAEQPCGEGGQGSRRALVATATLSITAEAEAGEETMAALAATLDPETWDRIRPAAEAAEQHAWASPDGVVVTVTFDDPVLVTAVFTPCQD
ncbi:MULTISPECIES: hypothetical protein [Microbacterium]|uniref:Uncharacterized protein n=1 Tax=Microbacterium wangchenii TaxID=2541726 RepID=A0ABX5SU93_9MICO|nr:MULTISPECIES: hypothetical protein [Microbacterium]MCK6067327.1 hypothetical protein [Microbacterium sp. EYE_512]QBR89731.1 hypothetical protein E4K62_14205 [Microbacterium wangchenii]TFV85408.1 hypothetical protein E4V99_10515 [Microbacterium sp. dk485]TXK16671.1 hypothetical protein FVP99_08310 [Microbacterium wangchenii]